MSTNQILGTVLSPWNVLAWRNENRRRRKTPSNQRKWQNSRAPQYLSSEIKCSSTLADVSSSCRYISHVEDTRLSGGRAFDGQYRNIGNHVEQWSNQIFRRCAWCGSGDTGLILIPDSHIGWFVSCLFSSFLGHFMTPAVLLFFTERCPRDSWHIRR